jgi:uncharacterized protein
MNARAQALELINHDASLRALRDAMAQLLDDDPGHDLEHSLRVAGWALRCAAETVCPRECVAAALLHDLVNLPKDHPERASASERSAAEARDLLPRHGFDAPASERIARAIEDHSFSRGATPRDPLGDALQDADRLEALGALGLMRTISTGVRMGARYFHADDPWAHGRALDDRKYSVDHFFTKLLTLPDTLRTPVGRAEGHRRARFLGDFLDQLGVELGHARTR